MPLRRRRAAASPRALACLLAVWSALCCLAPGRLWSAQEPAREPLPAGSVQLILRARMPAAGKPPLLTADGETFRAAPGLPCFYERRNFAPAWSGDAGPGRTADELLAALADAPADGLSAERYRLAGLRQQVSQARAQATASDLAELDLRLTDAFLRLAADLHNGAVNPELIYSDCELDIPETDLPVVLAAALASGEIRRTLADLAPAHAGYRSLRAALATYREIADRGGWPAVPRGPALRLGGSDARVDALRQRLEATGELAPGAAGPDADAADLFDAPLAAAVQRFQERHGLDADGVVGPGTVDALNVPAAARVRQIEINLDRWRWLPRDLGERHIVVNIAGFSLAVVEAGAPVLAMRVIAGKPTTRTPMFTGSMTQVVLNPYWNVPANIARNEILPRLKREPGYLASEGMEILPGGQIRQKPGPKNALGRIKFLFPNRFNVYLHDTPSRALFSRTVRSFSHGCIRIEKPQELAEYLLRDDPAWTAERIAAALATGRERWIPIPRPLPVHLAYWTAWVDAGGQVQFRDDLYGRDKPLYEILEPANTVTAEPSARKAEVGGAARGVAKPSP